MIKALGFKFDPLQEDVNLAKELVTAHHAYVAHRAATKSKKDVMIKDMHFRIFGIIAITYTQGIN